MTDSLIKKRLHVSGLTPSLTAADLSTRLGVYGTVEALDGFGAVDGVGRPRKFGYVTLQTTQTKLAKCMNILSGSTWKGAKLRIGEAKPDFRERVEKERNVSPPPSKRRRLNSKYHSQHADDMSLVTPENASSRQGWRVTPMGRILRPVRMRPEHPLPPLPSQTEKQSKEKKRAEPDSRARRRQIDMTLWGSTHLKGTFLDIPVRSGAVRQNEESTVLARDRERKNSGSEGDIEELNKPIKPSSPATHSPVNLERRDSEQFQDAPGSLAAEKDSALALLKSMFPGKDDDWGGQESLSSDIELDETEKPTTPITSAFLNDVDYEEVQRTVTVPVSSSAPRADENHGDIDEAAPMPKPDPQLAAQQSTKQSLKSLFAPREEEVNFSLLGHLDLDLELDDDVPFATSTNGEPLKDVAATIPAATQHTHKNTERIVPRRIELDLKAPPFFPSPASFPFHPDYMPTKNGSKDMGDWRSLGFYRTQTSDEIRAEWEEAKLELTRGWKKRWREASKMRKRRGAGEGDAM